MDDMRRNGQKPARRVQKAVAAAIARQQDEGRDLEAEMSALKGEDVDAGWGNQIRSYVLHPYKMVKDHRTNCESGNPQAVLDGRLDEFIEAYLKYKVGELVQ